MKKLILMMLLNVLILTTSFAQSAIKIKKGEAASFDGVLVTEEKIIELDKAKRSNLVLSDLRIAQDELIEYHKDDARLQRKKLSAAKFESDMKGIGMFVLGVVLTGFAFKVQQKIGDM